MSGFCVGDGRKGDKTPVGGLVGSATYKADEWEALLPWLLLGQGTQVGKSAVKGLGVYGITGLQPGYWHWLQNITEPAQTAG